MLDDLERAPIAEPLRATLAFLRKVTREHQAVTPDDVLRVARLYVQSDRLSMVMVGDAAKFKDQLGKAGFGNYELIPLSALDLSAADLKKH